MAGGPQEIDWDRLDKKKFFVVGVGLFSGVTTALYPLSVIKTRQMAAHKDVAAGMAGTKQLAKQIWRQEGVRGFYRGFGTVVFGTIPARSVYLTTLEVTKATVTKLGERFDISAPALAGAASFVGGGAASASTQAVVVPIDVISQRLMMQGVTGTTSSSSSPQGQQPLQQQQQQLLRQAAGGSSSSSSSSSSIRPAGSAAAVSSQPAASAAPAAAAAAPPEQPGTRGVHTSASSSSSRQQLVSKQQQQQQQPTLQQHSTASSRQHNPLHQRLVQQPYRSAVRQCSSTAAAQHMNGFQMARLIVQQEGVRGLYRGFWPSLATFVPNSALWWGAYGFWQRFLWEQMPQGSAAQLATAADSSSGSRGPSTGLVVGVQTTAAVLSGFTASVLTNPLDLVKTRLQVAEPVGGVVPTWGALLRELLAEEGVRGLMRGVAPRMASSAMWGTAMVSVYEFLKRLCAQPDV